jgi:hypothetical protein
MTSARRLAATLVALAASTLAACGGGGTSNPPPATSTGVFVDAPVANLRYRTATQSDVTDAQGRYRYLPGETVTFSIGAIDFPPIPATGIVSPMTVFGVEDPAHNVGAVNLARLLQSLDADGNTSNGITIDDAAHLAATASVDFEDDVGFEDSVMYVVTAARGETATLVSGTDAIAHLEAQFALVGAWAYGAGPDAIVFTFLASGQYGIAHGGTADEAGHPGSEFGSYTWNPETHAFTADAKVGALSDTNGEWGFSHPYDGARGTVNALVTVSGPSAVLFDPTSAVTMVLTRVYDAANPIVGSWVGVPDPQFALDGSADASVLTFLADGTYALASGGTPDLENGWPGVELGTYEWDPSGAFTAYAGLPALNTDGEWGFIGVDHQPNPNGTITVDTGIMSMHADGTVYYFKRVGRN